MAPAPPATAPTNPARSPRSLPTPTAAEGGDAEPSEADARGSDAAADSADGRLFLSEREITARLLPGDYFARVAPLFAAPAHAPGAEFGEGDRREWQDDEWGEGLVALLDAWVERVVREALALGEVT